MKYVNKYTGETISEATYNQLSQAGKNDYTPVKIETKSSLNMDDEVTKSIGSR